MRSAAFSYPSSPRPSFPSSRSPFSNTWSTSRKHPSNPHSSPRRPRSPSPSPSPSPSAFTSYALSYHSSSPNARPDAAEANFIPQTIEYAIRRAQHATAHALSSNITHVRVELPMGRSRKHWYRMSPLDSWYTETSVLAFHFCELFKGLRITLVLGTAPPVTHQVDWLTDVCRVDDLEHHRFAQGSDRVVVIAGVSKRQRNVIAKLLTRAPGAQAYIMLNCLLDVPFTEEIAPFRTAYACRASDKCAFLRESYDDAWAIFVEIAVFEYEWIGARTETPTQKSIETFALQRNARKKGMSGYYETGYAGCEAGFWPFMTICCRQVLPLNGATLARMQKEKSDKRSRGASRPFGFF